MMKKDIFLLFMKHLVWREGHKLKKQVVGTDTGNIGLTS